MAGPRDVLEMPALGRPFRLGMLYNCYRDALLPEHSLLDPEAYRNHAEQISHSICWRERFSSDTIGEKASALGIRPSLLTSLLCGLFEAEGCAKHLLSAKRVRRLGILTCRSLDIERFEKLDLKSLRDEHLSYPGRNKCSATHVVTGVWYGDQAFWDYDKEASFNRSFNPTPQTEAEERAQNQGLSFNWDGAPSLEQSPGPFQDPVKIPKCLGESKERGVPLKVHLYPLMDLDLKDSQIKYATVFHEIRDTLNSEIVDEMEGLLEIEARCNDLLHGPAATTFPEIGKKLHRFRDLCEQHKRDFQKQLAEMVPLVREGKKEEKDLEEVFKRRKESPFGTRRLNQFLDEKEQEVTIVNSVLSSLKEIKAISLQKELLEKIHDPNMDFVIVLMFTSLNEEEPYFSELRAFLSSSEQPETPQRETQSSPKWYKDQAVIGRAKGVAKSFRAFAHANRSSKKTQFLVASVQDESNPGTSIYLYESGVLDKTSFEPPSKPQPLEIEEISQNKVRLRLTPAPSGKDAISCYQVEGRTVGQEDWERSWVTSGKEGTVTVMDLCPGTEYEFRFASVSKPGTSERSDVCRAVRTLPAIPPRSTKETHGGAPLLGLRSEDTKRKERNSDSTRGSILAGNEGNKNSRDQSTNRGMDNPGGPLTSYSFPNDANPKAESGNTANFLCRTSHTRKEGHPSVYTLVLEKSVYNEEATYLKYVFGKEEAPRFSHKVVMFLGETGAGKSTLINRMVNHFLGVRWEDDFRYNVIQDGAKGSQAHSPTDRLTVYEINGSPGLQVPFSLNLIDTPGFGDTRGINHDKMLMEEIWEFFATQNGINHLDAICLVVQAFQTHLTQSQEYIFNAVLSVFGKDIRDNILVLTTFADGWTPPVLRAIEASDVPCARDAKGVPLHFTFNNFALFASNVPEDEDSFRLNQMVWEMGERSMDMFFQALNDLGPQCLALTTAVSHEWKELEAALQGMKPQVQMVLVKVEELKKTLRALEKHSGDIEANRDFEFEVERMNSVRNEIHDSTDGALNCQKCSYTCQYPCQGQNGKWRSTTKGNDSQQCSICPGGCPWQVHRLEGFTWEYYIITEKQGYMQLVVKYQKASRRAFRGGMILELVRRELQEAEKELAEVLEKASHHLQKVQKPALKTSSLTTSGYIDLLILSEEEEQQPGFAERIEMLKFLKGK